MEERIRISIGTEPKQWIASQVLKHSILTRTNAFVEFTTSWDPAREWHPKFNSNEKLSKRGTAFNTWRWLLPKVYGGSGKVIYLDADQLVLTDIRELWDSIPPGFCMAAVINAEGIFGRNKVHEKNCTQTSVMVLNLDYCTWSYSSLIKRVNKNDGSFRQYCIDHCRNNCKSDYAALMQAGWIPKQEIHELDPGWNHFGIVNGRTKLIHWSHVASQQ